MKGRFPITALGIGALVGLVVCYSIGWALGWIEFVAIGVGFLIALLFGLPFVIGGTPIEIDRTVEPRRVTVGGDATSLLVMTNPTKRPSAPRVVEDRVGGKARVLDVQALAPGASTRAVSTLPTDVRGVIKIGPALITRSDPLGLYRRDLGQTGVEQLWVHPRVAALPAMRSGFVKDLEGPTYDNSPAGDVAFHAIREYSVGDDVRHIHWMSTARTGTLMVRHFVDNRRPYLGVLVNSDPDALEADRFEVALEVAASLVVSAAQDNRPIAMWVGAQEVQTATTPADQSAAMDRFCVSQQLPSTKTTEEQYELLRLTDPSVSAFIYITGAESANDLLPLTSAAKKHGNVVVIRVAEPGIAPISLPNARVIDAQDLDQFAFTWRSLLG